VLACLAFLLLVVTDAAFVSHYARHRLCGTTFLFYNYETLDGLRPHLLPGHDSSEWPWQELAEPATKAFHAAEKRRAGR
jgi:hypothetical protein